MRRTWRQPGETTPVTVSVFMIANHLLCWCTGSNQGCIAASLHIHAVWSDCLLLTAQLQHIILMSLKLTLGSSRFRVGQVHHINSVWEGFNALSGVWKSPNFQLVNGQVNFRNLSLKFTCSVSLTDILFLWYLNFCYTKYKRVTCLVYILTLLLYG